MRAPGRTFVPDGGICSTAAPEPIDCNRRPAFIDSSVTCRRDFPWKSGMMISPKAGASERGLKPATTYFAQGCSEHVVAAFRPRSAGGFGSFTVYCGAYDGTS